MDYKKRFPNLSGFPSKAFELARHPFPFNNPMVYRLDEVDAPDQSVVFLSFNGPLSADESMSYSYLTEASPSCPMRNAFVFGEITWKDYWLSRDWLIQLEIPFPYYGDMVAAKYIHPTEMDYQSRDYMNRYDDKSPLEQHYELLYNSRQRATMRRDPDASELETRYQDFMRLYGNCLKNQAA